MSYNKLIQIILFGLFTQSNVIIAQIGNQEDINELKNRKLLVQIAEPNPDLIQELKEKHPDLLQGYLNAIDSYNANLRAAVESFWTWHSDFKFVSQKEIGEIKKTKSKEFAVLYPISVPFSAGGKYYYGLVWDFNIIKAGLIKYHEFTENGLYALQISLIEDYGKAIIFAASNRYLPTKTEMACMIYQMNTLRNDLSVGNHLIYNKIPKDTVKVRCADLKELTLLVNINNLSSDLNVEKIKNIYPYKVKVLNDEEIDSIVYTKAPGYAFLWGCPRYSELGSQYRIYFTIDFTSTNGDGYCVLNPLKLVHGTFEQDFDQMQAKIIDKSVIDLLVKSIE